MALDEQHHAAHRLDKARRRGFGFGLLKGMGVTLKHLFKHNTVIQYPEEKQDLSPRTRGVIALKEENCTVCMLCGRECPDWCIYIDSHKETLPPKREGGRPRKRNILDRFAIDYALCMYCGICVEVCPYDALFWSREFEYAEYDIRELTHEKERLSDWMASVLPPPPLEEGAELPGQPAAAGTPAVAAGAAGAGSAQRPSPPATATAAAERPEQAERAPAAAATAAPAATQATQSQQQAGETKAPEAPGGDQATEERTTATAAEQKAETAATDDTAQPEALKTSTEAKSPEPHDKPAEEGADAAAEAGPGTESTTSEAESAQVQTPGADVTDAERRPSADERASLAETPGPNVEIPSEPARPIALERTEDPEAVYEQVLDEQRAKGSSPQVAEARAKVARVKAERGIKRGPTPVATDKLVPSAPTKGQPAEPEPGGAPEAVEPQPPQGPVEPTSAEDDSGPSDPNSPDKTS